MALSKAPFLLMLAVVGLLSACTSSVTISARHSPLYRAEPHTSTISVQARSQSGIKRISIRVLTGDLVPCSGGNLGSIFPCRENGLVVTYTCNFSGNVAWQFPKTAKCDIPRGLNRWSLVTYSASAQTGTGKAASTNSITYSGGPAPPATIRHTYLPDDPNIDVTPWQHPSSGDVLRPVWLETDVPPRPFDTPQPITFDQQRRIDVAFHQDSDWGANQSGFMDAANLTIEQAHFSGPYFEYAQDYGLWRRLFSLWIGPMGAETRKPASCGVTFTQWAALSRAVTDGQAIVHDEWFRDCGTLGFGGWGTVVRDLNISGFVYIHESGHFLHCMADEYTEEGYTARYSCSDPPNTYSTQAACEQMATTLGLPNGHCAKIPHTEWWHVVIGPNDIMGDWAFPVGFWHSDWTDTNHHAIQKRMAKCLLGNCF